MKTIAIHSLNDLCQTILKFNKDKKYWFRGQSSEEYLLIPSAYRKLIYFEDQFSRPVNPRVFYPSLNRGRAEHLFIPSDLYLDAFEKELKAKDISYNSDMSRIDKFCHAQHYGVYTQMLDWTTDFSVACYFATSGREKGDNCALFLLDPVKWNNHYYCVEGVPETKQLTEAPYEIPIAFYAPKTNERICRQSGNFTMHGSLIYPLELINPEEDSEILIKLIIPEQVSIELEKYLISFGIDKESIYVGNPEENKIESIANSLKSINEDSFNEKMEEYRREWENTPISDRGIDNPIYI